MHRPTPHAVAAFERIKQLTEEIGRVMEGVPMAFNKETSGKRFEIYGLGIFGIVDDDVKTQDQRLIMHGDGQQIIKAYMSSFQHVNPRMWVAISMGLQLMISANEAHAKEHGIKIETITETPGDKPCPPS